MLEAELLVQKAVNGDVDAFTELVERYQSMAFAYALATLGDYQLAEDATQQALITAYGNLGSLRDPRRFGGWLRGIVRFESLRVVRERSRQRSVSIDAPEANAIVDDSANVERQAEIRSDIQNLTNQMARLPVHQRVVAQLYYLGDHSQAAVAEFLGLSVSTVNNRLREARAALRREGAYPMNKQSMKTPSFSEEIGKVIRANEQSLDAKFNNESRPPLLTAVTIGDPVRAITAFVSQYLDDDAARLVIVGESKGQPAAKDGMPVRSSGSATNSTVTPDAIEQLIHMNTEHQQRESVASGIKVIDLFAPLVQGGVVALVGDKNVGKLVLVEELAHRFKETSDQVTVLVFLKSPDELGAVHKLNMRVDGPLTTMMIPVEDASYEALASSLNQVDTVITMSGELARIGNYPAIDPALSHSNRMSSSSTVDRAREILRDQADDVRLQLLKAYLTQPFFVAEPYSGIPGVDVNPNDTEADLEKILAGEVSNLEPDALKMRGVLADVE